MTKRCEAIPCSTVSARSSRIVCWKCEKPFHLRCVGISNNQYKIIRDCSGAEWLCPLCRNSKSSMEQQTPALNSINERISSIIRLIGVQIDATRSLCRAYGQNIPRSSCCNRFLRANALNEVPKAPNEARNFDDELNNMQFEFSNIFNSFIAEPNPPADINGNKRNRTSSSSSSRLTSSRIGKRIRVDASVDTSDLLPGINEPGIGSAVFSDEVPRRNLLSHSVPVPISSSMNRETVPGKSNNHTVMPTLSTVEAKSSTPPPPSSNSIPSRLLNKDNLQFHPPVPATSSTVTGNMHSCICPAAAGRDTTPLILSSLTPQTNQMSYTHATRDDRPRFNDHQPSPAVPTLVPSQQYVSDNQRTTASSSASMAAVADIANTMQSKQRRHHTASNDRRVRRRQTSTSGLVISSENSPSLNTDVVQNTHANSLPMLSIAPPPRRDKWYYVTRFLPHETCENIVSYISGKCNCDPSLIKCYKLVRQNREDNRPISFVSFKLSVPDSFESIVNSRSFWPKGVSSTPFLGRTAARRDLTTPRIQHRIYAQDNPSSTPVIETQSNRESQCAGPVLRRVPPLPQRIMRASLM